MPQGPVKWFDPKKGYGFIVGPEGQDVFVHYSQIQSDGFRTLKDGESVTYELMQGDKGWQAREVRSVERGAPPKDTPGAAPSGPQFPAGYESADGSVAGRKAGGYESGGGYQAGGYSAAG